MLIHLQNVTKEFCNEDVATKALESVSFDVGEGEFVSIMGPSGSGKSTLMYIMGFLDRVSSGVYEFKGKSMEKLSDDELAKIRNEEIGFIFQTFNLLPRTTVLDNVMLPLTYSGKSEAVSKHLAEQAIASVGISHRLGHWPNQLSGGEQQRVAIARALVNNPSVIFADEPTGNLDSKSGRQVMEILQDLNEKGKTIVLVTHEQYTALHAKRIIRMLDGKQVADEQVGDQRQFAKDGELKK